MQDERTVRHPMKENILQRPRDAFSVRQGLSDNDTERQKMPGRRYGDLLSPRHPMRTNYLTASTAHLKTWMPTPMRTLPDSRS